MTALESTCEVLAEKFSKTKHKITIKNDGRVVFVDTVNISTSSAREKFLDAVATSFPAFDRELLEADLMKLAATEDAPAIRNDDLTEVDVSQVVRPELFHTSEVSGITIQVWINTGDKLVGRWRTHLRWKDGKREVIDTPKRLNMSGGTILYLHPDPVEPTGAEPPGWSPASRREWLDGGDTPAPELVFKRVCRQFAEYLDFQPDTAGGTTATLALWAMFSYVYPAWDAVPYLSIGGPLGSGKSRVLDVLQRLVFRPMSSSNLTAPTLFRTLHANGGTMLFDEAERLRQSTPEQQEIQSVFLSGYKRGGSATRLEPMGDSYRPVKFNLYGPKALASIAGLPPTLASRCIPITMFRAAKGSSKPKLRIDANPDEWQVIRDDLHLLALEHGTEWLKLAGRTDVVPAGIGGRDYELWQPLLALAGWLQDRGADNLLDLLQRYARASVTNAKDDAVPEADEVILELLAEAVREHRPPTSKELLTAAKLRDEATFKLWQPNTVTCRLKAYGIKAQRKVGGERRYRDVQPAQLLQIQERYGIDLEMA